MTLKDLELLKNKFPEKPNILGKEEYFNSAVLISLINIDDELHFLFEKRAPNIRQGGEICFPGGEIDSDDFSIEETVLRETKEEIGIDSENIQLIGMLDTLIGPRGITVDSYLGILNIKPEDCKIDLNEVEKVFTVPVSYFENNQPEEYTVLTKSKFYFYDSKGNEDNLIPSDSSNRDSYFESRRKVLVYKTKGEIIWGITARLVYQIIRLLKNN